MVKLASLHLPEMSPSSLRHRVTALLRQLIMSGQLQPGDRIVEEEVAEQLKVSRGPVREALRQLEQEGLVITYPYRGTEVLGISQEEINEVLVPIRLTLEAFAFRHALPRLTESDFARLQEIVARMQGAAGELDSDGIAEADVAFHELVIARSEQPHCLQIWRTIEPRVRAYFRRDVPSRASLAEHFEEHQQLLAALQTREPAVVLPLLEQHIRTYFDRNMNQLKRG